MYLVNKTLLTHFHVLEKERVCMNDGAEEFIRFVAETSTPAAMSVQEVEEESLLVLEISHLRKCITTGEWGHAP